MPDTADILKTLTERDSYAAVTEICRGQPAEVLRRFNQVSTDLYWKHRNLPACITIARAGVYYALMQTDCNREHLGHAKALTYNIASFTWIGWDEPGISISSQDMMTGLDAAQANLRLCQELGGDPLSLSRAYWMLAGHFLLLHHDVARGYFKESAQFATQAGAEAERLLSTGFALLVDQLCGQDVTAAMNDVKSALANQQHGKDFVQQIETAYRVFDGRQKR
jgi:hypothetical protein